MIKQFVIIASLSLALPHFHSQTPTPRTARSDQQAGPVVGKPFSGTELRRSTQILSDGTHIDRTETSQFFRDAQGRMRAQSGKRVLIYDPVVRESYDLFPATKIYQVGAIPEKVNTFSMAVIGENALTGTSTDSVGSTNPRPSKADARSVTEDLPPQMIGGVMAKGIRVTITIPAGTIGNDRDVKVINERWYSDELQVLLKSTNSDPRFGVTSYELTNIVMGLPDPSLFQVPADYTAHSGSKPRQK